MKTTTTAAARRQVASPRRADTSGDRRTSFLARGTVGQAVVATFASRHAAAEAALDLIASALPVSLDLLDAAAVDALNRFAELDPGWDGAAFLAIGLEGAADAAKVERLCARHGVTAFTVSADESSMSAVRTIVRAARPALASAGTGQPHHICVPVSRLPAFLTCLASIEERFGVEFGVVAHVGTGVIAPYVMGDDANNGPARAAVAALVLSMEHLLSAA